MPIISTRAEIRAKVRVLIKKPDTSQVSNSDLDDLINQYLSEQFHFDVNTADFENSFEYTLSSTDSGQYQLSSIESSLSISILAVLENMELDKVPIEFTQDHKRFWQDYPQDSGSAFVQNDADGQGVGLSYLSGDTTKATNNTAFIYKINGESYSMAAAQQITLTGDSVPVNLYGAWRLEVGTDGTIDIIEAADNATGYATTHLAVKGLPQENADHAPLGYIVARSTSGAFVPGTNTLLDLSNITFTEGFNSTRSTPLKILLYNRELYARPKPDNGYILKVPYIQRRNTLNTDGTGLTPLEWGNIVSYGAAILHLRDIDGNLDLAREHEQMFNRLVSQVNKRIFRQNTVNRVIKASF